MRSWISIWIASIGVLCLISPASAAVLDPDSVTLNVLPGNKLQQTLSLENDAAELKTYRLQVSGISFGSSADDLRFEDLETVKRAWIVLDQSEFSVGPGQTQVMNMEINVPDATDEQVFSFAVIAIEQATDGAGVGVTSGLASLFFIEIGEGLQPALELETFGVVSDNDRQLPVRFASLLANTAAGLSTPDIGIVIKNMWGKKIELISLNPTQRRLPGFTHRVFSEEWQGSAWRFGKYSAELFVFADEASPPIIASTSMVLLPWRTLSVFGVSGLFLAGVIYSFTRVRRR